MRIKCNTENLQKTFPQVYKNLFSKCSIVVSTPGTFHWTGEYSMNFGGMAINQKLPTRIYVGIEPISRKNMIEFDEMKFYIPSSEEFQDFQFDHYRSKKIISYLTEKIKALKNGDFMGFKINLVYEVPRASGLNTTSSFCSALMSAVMILFKKLSIDDYNKMMKMKMEDLINDKGFNFLFHETWKLNSLINNGVSSGATAFEALVSSRYPVVYFTEGRDGTDRKTTYNLKDDLDQIEKIKYLSFDMGTFFNLDKMPIWPIDFALIYSGSLKPSSRVLKTITTVEKSLSEISEYTTNTFKSFNGGDKKPFFYALNEKYGGYGMWYRYVSFLNMLGVDILHSFERIFSSSSSDAIKKFFRSVNLFNDMINLLDTNSPSTEYMINYLTEEAKNMSEDLGSATKICGIGRGGDILFITPYGTFRNHIYKSLEKSKSILHKNISIDYLSWEDGYGEDGLLIDQYIEEGVYSNFISKGGLSVRHLNDKGILHTDLYSREEFEDMSKKMDLLLDPMSGHVSVAGEILDSKKIHSAKATIEIFEILLNNLDKEVFNKDLPPSSYSSSRNELQSKIIIPLQKIIKKKIGSELNVSVSGSPNSFHVKLSPGNYHIHCIDKIF